VQRGSIDVSIPTWEWTLFDCQTVPIGSGKGSIWLSDSPNWAWQVRDSLSSLLRTNWLQPRGHTELDNPRRLAKHSTSGSANPRVSGRCGCGPGRPSGMPRECTWITAREEASSEGGGGVPDILILVATTFDDQLASEEVVWTFFLIVGVRIGLLGVTLDSISSCEIGTRHWTGEQGAAALVAAEDCTNNADLEWLLPARRDTKGVLDGGVWPYCGKPF